MSGKWKPMTCCDTYWIGRHRRCIGCGGRGRPARCIPTITGHGVRFDPNRPLRESLT